MSKKVNTIYTQAYRPEAVKLVLAQALGVKEAAHALTAAEFLHDYLLTDDGMLKIGEASPSGAGRNRTLRLEKLMVIEVPTPSLATQQTFDRQEAEITVLKAKHTAIREANAALLPATLERVFTEEH